MNIEAIKSFLKEIHPYKRGNFADAERFNRQFPFLKDGYNHWEEFLGCEVVLLSLFHKHLLLENSLQEWISVGERLPDKDGWYLAIDDERIDIVLFKYQRWVSRIGTYDSNNVFTRNDLTDYITHWMPLPKKP